MNEAFECYGGIDKVCEKEIYTVKVNVSGV